jgi:hypothetical protein
MSLFSGFTSQPITLCSRHYAFRLHWIRWVFIEAKGKTALEQELNAESQAELSLESSFDTVTFMGNRAITTIAVKYKKEKS